MEVAWKTSAARGLGWLLILTPALGTAQVQVAVSAPSTAKVLEEGAAQEDGGKPIEGPVLGYVFDREKQLLWPLIGIAGASQMAPAFQLGVHLGGLEISSQQNYGLGHQTGTGEVHLFDLSGAQPAEREISGLDTGIDRIVLSPSGDAAGLYDRQTKQVQIVTGLPDEPQVRGRVSVESLPGVLAALAISDSGELLLAGVSETARGSVHLLGPQRSPRSVLPLGRPSSIAFLHNSSDAVITDYDRSEVVLVRDIAGAAQPNVLGGEREGILKPVAVAASADNARIFAASAQTKQVAILDINGGTPTFVRCECQPSRLKALADTAVFRITSSSVSPVLLLDAGHESNGQLVPRIVFVPPGNDVMEPSLAPDPPRLPRGRALR
jgi:hypothetical protein